VSSARSYIYTNAVTYTQVLLHDGRSTSPNLTEVCKSEVQSSAYYGPIKLIKYDALRNTLSNKCTIFQSQTAVPVSAHVFKLQWLQKNLYKLLIKKMKRLIYTCSEKTRQIQNQTTFDETVSYEEISQLLCQFRGIQTIHLMFTHIIKLIRASKEQHTKEAKTRVRQAYIFTTFPPK
jgi:hypothetical protein